MYVVATAGHVDHGKSTLVRALTGMEPDRWAEERRRGMTIDLGFAWTTLGSGARVAFVDVPGHERFVGNMLAGVGPVPAVMIVVAADEGWMPQSAEHLAAIEALGVRHGLLVVTRADLADPADALAQGLAEIAATPLGEVESVVVSGATGAGLGELRGALERLCVALPVPDPAGPVRIWIDRAFTVKGSGTVVTGTLPAGTVGVGDELLLGSVPVRVRGLQTLKEKTDSVTAVARVAVNLRGVDRAEVHRGMALVTPGGWTSTTTIDVGLSAEPSGSGAVGGAVVGGGRDGLSDVGPAGGGRAWHGRPAGASEGSGSGRGVGMGREVIVHLGSAAVVARVRPLGPGTARLTLASPLALHVGDLALLRDPGSRRVVGVTVLDVAPPPLTRRGAAAARGAELAEGAEGLEAAPSVVAGRGVAAGGGSEVTDRPGALGGAPSVSAGPGASAGQGAELAERSGGLEAAPSALAGRGAAAGLSAGRAVVPDGLLVLRRVGVMRRGELVAMGLVAPEPVVDDWVADAGHWTWLGGRLAEVVTEYAAAHPLERGVPIEVARVGLGLPDRCLVTALVDGGGSLRTEAGRVIGTEPSLPPQVARGVATVLGELAEAPFQAPSGARLDELGLTGKALAAAVRAGTLLKIVDGIVLAPDAVRLAAAVLSELAQPFTVSEARQAMGTSRRVAIPLLEYLDRHDVTLRLDDGRRRLGP